MTKGFDTTEFIEAMENLSSLLLRRLRRYKERLKQFHAPSGDSDINEIAYLEIHESAFSLIVENAKCTFYRMKEADRLYYEWSRKYLSAEEFLEISPMIQQIKDLQELTSHQVTSYDYAMDAQTLCEQIRLRVKRPESCYHLLLQIYTAMQNTMDQSMAFLLAYIFAQTVYHFTKLLQLEDGGNGFSGTT